MCKTISPFFYYSELKRYEHKKSFIGHQYKRICNYALTSGWFACIRCDFMSKKQIVCVFQAISLSSKLYNIEN